MLYLNSILFTMLRNYGIEKLREALCTDMVEYPSFTHPLSPRQSVRRKGPADRPPTERLALADQRRNSARVSPRSGQSLLGASLFFSPVVSRTAFDRSSALSVAGRRALSEVLAGPFASLSPSARFSAAFLPAVGSVAGSVPGPVTREYVLTRGVATPP